MKVKDVCLLLGHTAASKSTTIHFLAGSQMLRDPNTDHIFPVNVKMKELKKIATVQKMTESFTRFASSTTLMVISKGDMIGRMIGLKYLANAVAKLHPNCSMYHKNLAIIPLFTHMEFIDGKTLKHLFNFK